MQTIAAGQFKAHCLQLLNEVDEKHKSLLITKRGKPVAKLVPIENKKSRSILGCMKGSMTFHGDIISPIDVKWDAQQDD